MHGYEGYPSFFILLVVASCGIILRELLKHCLTTDFHFLFHHNMTACWQWLHTNFECLNDFAAELFFLQQQKETYLFNSVEQRRGEENVSPFQLFKYALYLTLNVRIQKQISSSYFFFFFLSSSRCLSIFGVSLFYRILFFVFGSFCHLFFLSSICDVHLKLTRLCIRNFIFEKKKESHTAAIVCGSNRVTVCYY